MTDTQEPQEREPQQQAPLEWKPRGHPVRWAIGLSAGVALVSGVSIWLGALAPRLGTQPLAWGEGASDDDGVVELVVELTNEAHTDATVVGGGESVPGLELEGMDLSSEPNGPPDGADRLAAGGGRLWATLRYRVTDCAAIPPEPPAVPFTVRTALGVEQTVAELDELGTYDGVENHAWTIQLTKSACR